MKIKLYLIILLQGTTSLLWAADPAEHAAKVEEAQKMFAEYEKNDNNHQGNDQTLTGDFFQQFELHLKQKKTHWAAAFNPPIPSCLPEIERCLAACANFRKEVIIWMMTNALVQQQTSSEIHRAVFHSVMGGKNIFLKRVEDEQNAIGMRIDFLKKYANVIPNN